MVNSPKGSHKDEAESSSTKGKTGAPVLRPLPAPSTLPKLGGVHYPGAIASDRDEDGQRTIISATPVVAVAHAAQPPEAPATAFEGTNEVFIQSKVFETLHDETGKAVVKPGNVFEGTNEVYIQSRVFETLHDETGKAVIKPGNVFEGTNEIFIQSKVFDALGDDAKSDETKAGTPSSKLAAKRTSLTRSDAPADKPTVKRASFSKLAPVEKNTTKRTNPNEPDKTVDKPSLKSAVLGVRVSSLLPRANADKGVPDSMLIELQNSGILPNVDFDKSLDLDLSALDGLEGTLETTPSTELPLPSALAKAAPETSSSAQAAPSPSEVFVSKIRDKAASRPLPKAASASLVTATKPKPTDAHAGLHPDDCPTASTSPHAAYPIVHLFETCQRTILDNTIPFAGHQKSLATLMEHILDASVLPEPKFIQLMGDCPWDRERFTVHFLEQCYRQITNCTIYSTVKNTRREPVHHCFASLLSSRIGITQDDPDDIKTERILKSAETLVSEGQTVWALNTMLAYYGLRALLSGNKNYDHLLDHPEQLETQISEVCLSAIAESASHGMVIVVITELGTHRYNAWREVVGAIRQRCMRNVVVILLTNDALCQEFDCLTPLQLSPLNHQDMLTIARQSMSEFKIPPPAFLEKLAKKSHGSLSQFACIAKLLKQHGTLKFEHYHHCIDTKDGFLDSLPETYADLALMHFNALSEDQRYFMSVASLIGSPFNLDDISAILSLQALPDEIPWFHNLRKPWSKRVVEELVKLGEIRPILDRDHQVCGYGIVDELAARQIAKTLDPDFLQAVHGCFARYLERLRPGDPQIARQYDAAGLWEQAVKHWLVIAR
ncbi:MAG: hypothetical protein FWC40_09855, partial [Proteobacteria bacterium]|nr:hypothetical protein [Pseudomonadota bacterium]